MNILKKIKKYFNKHYDEKMRKSVSTDRISSEDSRSDMEKGSFGTKISDLNTTIDSFSSMERPESPSVDGSIKEKRLLKMQNSPKLCYISDEIFANQQLYKKGNFKKLITLGDAREEESKLISVIADQETKLQAIQDLIKYNEQRQEDVKELMTLRDARKEESKLIRLTVAAKTKLQTIQEIVQHNEQRQEDFKELITLEDARKEESKLIKKKSRTLDEEIKLETIQEIIKYNEQMDDNLRLYLNEKATSNIISRKDMKKAKGNMIALGAKNLLEDKQNSIMYPLGKEGGVNATYKSQEWMLDSIPDVKTKFSFIDKNQKMYYPKNANDQRIYTDCDIFEPETFEDAEKQFEFLVCKLKELYVEGVAHPVKNLSESTATKIEEEDIPERFRVPDEEVEYGTLDSDFGEVVKDNHIQNEHKPTHKNDISTSARDIEQQISKTYHEIYNLYFVIKANSNSNLPNLTNAEKSQYFQEQKTIVRNYAESNIRTFFNKYYDLTQVVGDGLADQILPGLSTLFVSTNTLLNTVPSDNVTLEDMKYKSLLFKKQEEQLDQITAVLIAVEIGELRASKYDLNELNIDVIKNKVGAEKFSECKKNVLAHITSRSEFSTTRLYKSINKYHEALLNPSNIEKLVTHAGQNEQHALMAAEKVYYDVLGNIFPSQYPKVSSQQINQNTLATHSPAVGSMQTLDQYIGSKTTQEAIDISNLAILRPLFDQDFHPRNAVPSKDGKSVINIDGGLSGTVFFDNADDYLKKLSLLLHGRDYVTSNNNQNNHIAQNVSYDIDNVIKAVNTFVSFDANQTCNTIENNFLSLPEQGQYYFGIDMANFFNGEMQLKESAAANGYIPTTNNSKDMFGDILNLRYDKQEKKFTMLKPGEDGYIDRKVLFRDKEAFAATMMQQCRMLEEQRKDIMIDVQAKLRIFKEKNKQKFKDPQFKSKGWLSEFLKTQDKISVNLKKEKERLAKKSENPQYHKIIKKRYGASII